MMVNSKRYLSNEIHNPLELQAALNGLMSKKFDSDRMLQFSSSEIKIICDDEVQWTLDLEKMADICKEVTEKPSICVTDSL